MVQFLLNQTVVTLDKEAADLTVLDFLREHCNKRGTKEGCASGDCGACTVVTASLDPADDHRLVYQSLNSCITFLGAVHGRQLLTVEDLQDSGQLHRVQQVMVDLHGSQCGFCTPGFIMSMFALYKNAATVPAGPEQRATIEHYLGGNLCRCTGYRPIVDACIRLLDETRENSITDKFDAVTGTTVAALQTIRQAGLKPAQRSTPMFYLPLTLDELDQLLFDHPDARILAGGTDLALEVTQQLASIDEIICVAQLQDLQTVTISDDACMLGAGVTLNQCLLHLGSVLPDLGRLLHRFGSMQIRNQGTIGGNIANASPIGDLPPVLLALDAILVVRSVAGTREISAADFFLGYRQTALQPGEYVLRVELDRLRHFRGDNPLSRLHIYKISKRLDDDISAVCGVFNLSVRDGRIESAKVAFGGMAAVPARAPEVEQALTGQAITPELIVAAKTALEHDFQPIDDARASAAYRTQVAGNLLERVYYEWMLPDIQTQVIDYAG